MAYFKEEIKELKQINSELKENAEKNKERAEELLVDNTEMATHLLNISKLGPVDFEEFKLIRESAALVLEENNLLKESQEAVTMRLEKIQQDTSYQISLAKEDNSSLYSPLYPHILSNRGFLRLCECLSGVGNIGSMPDSNL